jgi:RAT1-interacting protein
MTKFLVLPYANDSWELGATLHKGTIYLEEHKGPDRYEDENAQRFTYYGYKFESLCTSSLKPTTRDTPEAIKQRNEAPCDTNVQFCSVFSSKLGGFSLICGGEVDCLYASKRDPDKFSYAELKTNRVIKSERQHTNFVKFKLLKTWAQSFLVGIRTVIFGYRDDGRNI